MSAQPTPDTIDTFLRDAVVVYRSSEAPDPARWASAGAFRDSHNTVSRWSIYTAAVCGDVDAVRYWLEQQPELLNIRGGSHQWEPLMYAAYSRLDGPSTYHVAKFLIERGADPNAMERVDNHYRFTALTGVFGHGEGGTVRQPAHPDCEKFARLLLDAGAHPNDSQATYNRMFTPDNLCLELLLEYGLNDQHQNNWTLEDGEPHPQKTLQYQLDYAIERGFSARVSLLLNANVGLQYLSDGQSPWKRAMLAGRNDYARWFEAKGAIEEVLTPAEQLVNKVLSADGAGALTLMNSHTNLVSEVKKTHADIAEKAIQLEEVAALELVLALELDPGLHHGHTAAHKAAYNGRVDMLRVMRDAGVDLTVRDHHYCVPPVGWALHAGESEAVAFLDQCDMDPFTAAARDNVDRLAMFIDTTPALLQMTFGDFLIQAGRTDTEDVALASRTLLDFAIGSGSAAAETYLKEQGAAHTQ